MSNAAWPTVHRDRRVGRGRLRVRAVSEAAADAALELGDDLASSDAKLGERVRFLDEPCYLKASPLAPRPALRHGMRGWILGSGPPRLREFENLRWMEGRLFQVAEPVAAGCLSRRGLPRYQFLLTREVPETTDLAHYLDAADDLERGRTLAELAREVARLHSLHFTHHDLFPRNILVRAGAPRRVFFLDAWAGGPGPWSRGPGYDLGCLFLEGAERFTAPEQLAFLRRYLDEREAQDRPLRAGPLVRSITRARRAQLALHERQPARLRGARLPTRDWPAPELVRALTEPSHG